MSVSPSHSELAPAVCRVCLAVDVRLHTIAETPLQLVYEKLTNISLNTADKRPLAACYICYALLYKSGKLLLTAAKSEKVLTDVLKMYSKITIESICLVDREANGLAGSLTASKAEYFDNIPPVKEENLNEMKTEPGLEDDYTEMEFEDSYGGPQSLHEDACNNNDETHVNDDEDKIPVDTFIAAQKCAAAGELLEEMKIQKDDEMEKHRSENYSTTRKRKHDSGESKTFTGDRRYKCDDCQQPFRNKSFLERHIERLVCKKYHCDTCQKQFKNSHVYKNHVRIHTDETPYECKVCPIKFNTVGNLNRHIKAMHGNSTFECNICQRKFNRKDYLKSHLKVHSSDKLYDCSICKLQFKDQSNYNRHLKQHTNGKSYECNICQNKYTLLHHLKTHLRSHTGEKPYVCKQCPMSFSHQSHWRTHTRTHTGEKPFECNVCKRKFNRQAHLQSHLKIHDA